MEINFNAVLTDFDGEPFLDGGEKLTLGTLCYMAVSNVPSGPTTSVAQLTDEAALALDIYLAKKGNGVLDLDESKRAVIKAAVASLVGRAYPKMAPAQALRLLGNDAQLLVPKEAAAQPMAAE